MPPATTNKHLDPSLEQHAGSKSWVPKRRRNKRAGPQSQSSDEGEADEAEGDEEEHDWDEDDDPSSPACTGEPSVMLLIDCFLPYSIHRLAAAG